MKSLIQQSIRHPIVAKVFILLLVIFGFTGLKSMKTNFFTPLEPNFMRIVVAYPGASPAEVEESIVIKIENNLNGIPGIEQVISAASENLAMITIEFKKGSNPENVLEDVKNAVNTINSFPENAEKPIIYKEPSIDPTATLSIMGNVPLKTLKDAAQKVQQDLMNIEGISLVSLVGLPEEEIHILCSPEQMEQLGLTFTDISMAVNQSNLDITAGKVSTETENFIIRNTQKQNTVTHIESTIIKASPTGLIRLKDVATVKESWSEGAEINTFNGKQSIEIQVDKTVNEDLLSMIDSIKAYIQNYSPPNESLELILSSDRSNILKQRIGLLTKNGLTGFFLIMLTLTLFLSFRLSFWVALSIPISFFGFFFIGNILGVTINVISLFGLIVVIGILVDDGIIIAENIYQHYERGSTPFDAAVNGTVEVLPSILTAITTTIVAFSPFFFLDGMSSKIMSDIAVVVIITLLASLIEGLLILPCHLAYSKVLKPKTSTNPLKQRLESSILKLRNHYFKTALLTSIQHKTITILVSIGLLLFTFGCLKAGIIKTTFFPFIDNDYTLVSVTMPPGTKHKETQRILNQIESKLPIVNSAFKANRKDNKDIILSVSKTVEKSGHKGRMRIQLLDGETRNIESFEITQAIRDEVGDLPETESMVFGARNIFGKPVVISLKSNNLNDLNAIKSEVKTALQDVDTIKDISDPDTLGAPEINITFIPELQMLGLTPSNVMTYIRQAFYGLDIQNVQRSINEITIRTLFEDSQTNTVAKLENLMIPKPNGDLIPLSSIATIRIEKGIQTIKHINGVREMRLEANLADEKAPLPPILADINTTILTPILKQYPSVTASFEGQQKEQSKMGKSMGTVMPIMMITMFAIISLGFGSFYQALLILLLIPFGFIGVAWGHALHQIPLNVLSTYGIIALIGIIVNDSIVLTNTFNRFLKKGYSLHDAVVEASISRFRPIVLTSITTIAGLGPLILENSKQAQFLIPMAISITYGLLITTVFILILLPLFILTGNHLKLWVFRVCGKTIAAESLEPAIITKESLHDIN